LRITVSQVNGDKQMVELDALLKLNYGMCIISAKNGSQMNGCIVNTVFQVTATPPFIAVSISRENLTYDFILASRRFAVSVLSEEAPLEFISGFGFRNGRNFNKFEDVHFIFGQTGAPIITDYTVAFIEADVINSIDAGPHTIFIAEVINCETLNNQLLPMTYEYYRSVANGKTPRTAPTYYPEE
jgi:ferric-chelate reductase [NAD(P)H]